ncbi:helix-turn-helix domain-containing protein [Streptomyces sanglieri]|uniref:helix-turn-helix domain-containing protein n=1 Tax=Streptomyces sanglieri TaxID=193460 RepID=UPI0035234AE7
MEHDETLGGDLVRTALAYFTCDGNLSRTASALYVHVNTLYQRMERRRPAARPSRRGTASPRRPGCCHARAASPRPWCCPSRRRGPVRRPQCADRTPSHHHRRRRRSSPGPRWRTR